MQLDFTEAFYEAAYRLVGYNMCETEHDKKLFAVVCEVASKYGLTVQKLLELLNELNKRTEEVKDANN